MLTSLQSLLMKLTALAMWYRPMATYSCLRFRSSCVCFEACDDGAARFFAVWVAPVYTIHTWQDLTCPMSGEAPAKE